MFIFHFRKTILATVGKELKLGKTVGRRPVKDSSFIISLPVAQARNERDLHFFLEGVEMKKREWALETCEEAACGSLAIS